jgi:hypothetical protein
MSTDDPMARQLLAERVQRFLDSTERLTRWQFDNVDQAIDAFLAEDFAEGADLMLLAEEPQLIRAPTDFDGGNGSGAALRERLSTILAGRQVQASGLVVPPRSRSSPPKNVSPT